MTSARNRFIPDPWLIPAVQADLSELSDSEPFLVPSIRIKKAFTNGHRFSSEERRKKYFGDSTGFQGGHSLQGLWAMPGRRR